jgi:hypothetical protein
LEEKGIWRWHQRYRRDAHGNTPVTPTPTPAAAAVVPPVIPWFWIIIASDGFIITKLKKRDKVIEWELNRKV